MKKITLLTALACASLFLAAHADTATPPAQQNSPTNAAAPSKSAPAKQERHVEKQQESPSVYESVKSGWNSFIDLLAGPSTN